MIVSKIYETKEEDITAVVYEDGKCTNFIYSPELVAVEEEMCIRDREIIDQSLNNQAIESVSNSIRALEKISSCGEVYQDKLSELKNVYYEIQELARDISGMKEDIFFDEQERNNVEARLDEIFSLKRKYGNRCV